MSVTLYPELVDYIYQFCDDFKTVDEILAGRTLLYSISDINKQLLAVSEDKGWYSNEPHIQAMIADGFMTFKIKGVERIYREHRDELKLNLCPKCFKIARTPSARQCRFCFHDWH